MNPPTHASSSDAGKDSHILRTAEAIAQEFVYTRDDVREATRHFRAQMNEGLQRHGNSMAQIPSFVTAVPDGSEEGVYLVVDLGGTNFRVCSVQLYGDSTYDITQMKVPVPKHVMLSETYKTLFAFLAEQIRVFLQTHHPDRLAAFQTQSAKISQIDRLVSDELFRLGFTFSFTVEQQAVNKGVLMAWDKGFNIPDAIGKNVCVMLQEQLDEIALPVVVTALVNDAVSTLMARSYTSSSQSATLLGAIFGTGTNGAYVEDIANIDKLRESPALGYDSLADKMIINSEWGGFDYVPNTQYDACVDEMSVNPGSQLFEKRISGMYLGEILRRAILTLLNAGVDFLTTLPPNSAVFSQWGIDSSFLSTLASDHSQNLAVIRHEIQQLFQASHVSLEEAQAVKMIGRAIAQRSARLAGVAIAAVVSQSGKLIAPKIDTLAEPLAPSKISYSPQETNMSRATTSSSSTSTTSKKATSSWLSRHIPTFTWPFTAFNACLSLVSFFRFDRDHGKEAPLPVQFQRDEPLDAKPSTPRSNSRPLSKMRRTSDDVIDIAVDGSLVEFYPNFISGIRSALRDLDEIGPAGDARINISMTKDGSGVGAALITHAAVLQEREMLAQIGVREA